MADREPTYLGDAVTVDHDGFQLILVADGTQRVCLDGHVFTALIRFVIRSGLVDAEGLKEFIDRVVEE